MSRCRRYAFTLHENPEDFYLVLKCAQEWKEFPPDVEYMCGQVEKCPKTDKLHFQGYLRLNKGMSMSAVKKLPCWQGRQPHLEACKGTEEQNIEYCNKSETCYLPFIEHGRRATPGKAKTADDFAEAIKRGDSELKLLEEHPALYIRHYRAVQHIRTNVLPQPDRDETQFIFCYGRPGSGKSRWATQEFAKGEYFNASNAPAWWDGYQGDKIVIIDDFVSTGWRHDFINQLGSDIKMRVPVKGATVPFTARWVVFTSNYLPAHHFQSEVTREAFCRRVKRWLYFHGENYGFYESASYGDFLNDTQPLQPPILVREWHTRDVLMNTDSLPETVIHPFLNLTQD